MQRRLLDQSVWVAPGWSGRRKRHAGNIFRAASASSVVAYCNDYACSVAARQLDTGKNPRAFDAVVIQ